MVNNERLEVPSLLKFNIKLFSYIYLFIVINLRLKLKYCDITRCVNKRFLQQNKKRSRVLCKRTVQFLCISHLYLSVLDVTSTGWPEGTPTWSWASRCQIAWLASAQRLHRGTRTPGVLPPAPESDLESQPDTVTSLFWGEQYSEHKATRMQEALRSRPNAQRSLRAVRKSISTFDKNASKHY